MFNYRFLILLLVSLPLYSKERFADVDLWLPSTYQNHYLRLLDAAEKVKLDPYCNKILKGGLAEGRSTLDHPIFSFTCRAQDKRSFSILVDSKTLELTNNYQEKELDLENRERQAMRKKLEDELNSFTHWLVCRKSMRKRLTLFESVKVLTETPPHPGYHEGEFHYVVDFNALSPSRKPLHFTIDCKIKNPDDFSVKVFPRKVESTKKPG